MKTLIVAMLATLTAALTAHAQNPNRPRVDRRGTEGRQSNTKEQRIADDRSCGCHLWKSRPVRYGHLARERR